MLATTKWFALIFCVASSLAAERHGDNPFNDQFLQEVQAKAKTWTPDSSFEAGIRYGAFASLPGIHESLTDFSLLTKRYHASLTSMDLPIRFDAREKWPQCESLRMIRNQGTCGSCWAVAATSVMSDRLCIHSGGRINVDLAAEDLMGCCHDCGEGCNGGFLDGSSFLYWVDAGVVSGAPFNSTDGCKPYPFKPCTYPFKNCAKETSPKCVHHCISEFDGKYKKDKFYGEVAYKVPNDERMIQWEIMTNGPVESGFKVFQDYYFYKSGVYQHVKGDRVGKHAIRILGWGWENGVPYWLIANSYGTGWGEDGYFKFLRGSNHLGIEETVIAGLPKLS
ncbi:cathepsin B-like [Uranotaenia lowii]|uniref:cathepsin B-like n=1 Tax=Uranotaenia lowii TaxID=190385 RepID=UPI00247A55A7|nr:cathepsin B-like [Uranotaenia lowii]